MDKKFINAKSIAIPILSLIMLVSQISPAFAVSKNELLDFVKTSPTVTLEYYAPSQMPSVIAYNNIVNEGFIDVTPDSWYYNDVMKAKQAGLVQGIGNNKYGPELTITYAHFITTLVRVYKADEDIPDVPNSKHWSDKYIAEARKLGMLDKGEKVNPDAPIPRQEMIRYTVNLLGLEPAESADIIFADVKPEDAAYINTAFKEYLTEGKGYNKTLGLRVFGYDTTALRSEMSAMVNRVAAYKADPVAFKAERAKARVESEKKAGFTDKSGEYTMFNGYVVPKNNRYLYTKDTRLDFLGWVIFETRPENYDVIEAILSSKLDPKVVKQAVDYGRTKEKGVNLPYKYFKSGEYEISVSSAPTSDRVTFQVYLAD